MYARNTRSWLRTLSAATVLTTALTAMPTATAVPAARQPMPDASLTYDSESGEWLGQGRSERFDAPENFFFLSGNAEESLRLEMESPDHGPSWDVVLSPKAGTVLRPGHYPGADNSLDEERRTPGLDVSGDGRSCNRAHGEFTIHQLVLDSIGRPLNLKASFVQYCEDSTAAMRGTVDYQRPLQEFQYRATGDHPLAPEGHRRIISSNGYFRLSGGPGWPQLHVDDDRDTWRIAMSTRRLKEKFVAGREYTFDSRRPTSDGLPQLFFHSLGHQECKDHWGTFRFDQFEADAQNRMIGMAGSLTHRCSPGGELTVRFKVGTGGTKAVPAGRR